MRLAIVVPTYNEANNVSALTQQISEVVTGVPGVDTTLIYLDDSSPDGTADLIQRIAPSHELSNFHVRVMVKQAKEGLGAAYIFGFTQLLHEDFDYFLQMDADLSHNPKYLTGFIHQGTLGTDLVVASRYIPGGGTPDWSLKRRVLSRGGNFYARNVLSRRITDYTGGFNMYSAKLLRRIKPHTITATGYGFILVLKYRALLGCTSMTELPIVFFDRTHGQSKIPRNTLLRNFVLVPRIRMLRGR
ncbi:polyprenol monophosphomannose synthase [Salinibacterium sp. ZJ454]|uniref:polyprenol monophosphomannose synthase n=1 Tax=Salinibacterium sp. ZJ454 TaxID=2708339 RepID=UPI00142413ED|nr:polyprenol monophosphomannose synthase [Salinibacterium sp. ZJ454]